MFDGIEEVQARLTDQRYVCDRRLATVVFLDPHYDPIFVIEANFDGPPGPFWAQLEATLGSYLRPMLRCCKRPSNEDGPLYDAVTKVDSRYPIAPYLERKTLRPSVFHQGNRGLDRNRILREGELFLATRTELAQPDPTAPNRGTCPPPWATIAPVGPTQGPQESTTVTAIEQIKQNI